jgi:GNAT superfamily N-acetyltransferase
LDAYRELRLEALRDHPGAFAMDYEDARALPVEGWRSRMMNPLGALFLAQAGAGLAGMTGIVHGNSPKTAHSALIWGVYVRPAWRGTGMAAGLIRSATAWAAAHGVAIVKLAVNASNTRALRFYLREGFIQYGTEPDALRIDAAGCDEHLLFKRLL